jgi:uncharacterized protein YbbC (DUF1343 family)
MPSRRVGSRFRVVAGVVGAKSARAGSWIARGKATLLLLVLWSRAASAEVLLGIDVLEANRFAPLLGKRIGLITNPTGVNRRGEPTWGALHRARGVHLVALFSAEHGFDGKARAGLEVRDSTHSETGLPIFSLYGPGPTRRPTARMLNGLDLVIYDIQDTGCRSYTFISTMGLAMEACAANGVEFMVLDRPNPLGGLRVEGPGLDRRFRSFVGQWPVPYAYGLTSGELARMINGEGWISNRCALRVVAMKGWKRHMTWQDTGLRWVPSSPNVPLGDTPLYLVATGILGEIGGLNLGTGTPLSFQLIGAGWLDSVGLARRLNACGLDGIHFEPLEMDFNKRAEDGKELRGARVRVRKRATAPLLPVSIHALEAVRETAGRDLFALARQRGKRWDLFDKVCGSDQVRQALQAGRPAKEIVASWAPGVDAFRKRREPYLLYRQ